MSISDAEFDTWLEDPNTERCILVEISYSGGTLYASNKGFVSDPTDTPASTPYPAYLRNAPIITESIFGDDNAGTLEFINDGTLDTYIDEAFSGWGMTLYMGDESWKKSDFREIMSGTILNVTAPSSHSLVFQLRDRRDRLRRIIDDDLAGDRPVPICIGKCFNVEPVLIESTTYKFRVHSGAVTSIDAVRDNGVAVSYTASTTSGWFTLASNPAGKITADVTGTGTATMAGIIDWLARAIGLGDDDIDNTNLALFNTATSGWFGKGTDQVWSIAADVAASGGGSITFTPEGELQVKRVEAPKTSADYTIGRDLVEVNGVTIVSVDQPYNQITVTYQQNYCIQDADSLAGSVTAANRDLYSRPNTKSISVNTGITTTWPLAESPEVMSVIYNKADADTESARRAALRSTVKLNYRVNVLAKGWKIRPGDTVDVTYPRFGLDSGKKLLVTRKTIILSTLRVTLDLWG